MKEQIWLSRSNLRIVKLSYSFSNAATGKANYYLQFIQKELAKQHNQTCEPRLYPPLVSKLTSKWGDGPASAKAVHFPFIFN